VAESYKRTEFGISVSANLIRGTDMLDVFSFNVSCEPEMETDSLFTEIREKLDLARESGSIKSGKMPVVFTPLAFMLSVGPALGMGFNGKMVEQGASPLAKRVGQKVFDERLSVHDDATLDKRPRSSPFDDEGVSTRKVTLVDKGVVSEFLYDLQTAGKVGTRSTGNGYRGQGSPSPGSTATVVDAGEGSIEEIIADIKEGLIVEYLLGGGQANVLRGDFGGNVHLGFKIENGQLAGRVKNTLIAGNTYEVLADIRRVGGERRWVGGSLYCPPIALEGVTVSTKES
jgi:PmbA protein